MGQVFFGAHGVDVVGVVGLMLLAGVITLNGIHQVPEGFVGVYFRGGALLNGIVEPGWHTKLPAVTSYDTL